MSPSYGDKDWIVVGEKSPQFYIVGVLSWAMISDENVPMSLLKIEVMIVPIF